MTTNRVFDKLQRAWVKNPRYVSLCGGARSGKTFSVLQLLYMYMDIREGKNKRPLVVSVVSESMPHLKRGAIRDFKVILRAEGLWSDDRWSETDKTYTFDQGGIIEFFSVDNAGKVYGASRDILFINECQHVDYETARQLFIRTRRNILLDYNPTHSFWNNERIESRDNCIRIHSTYKDNDFLTVEQIAEIESNKADANWWRVFGLGLVGQLDGLIYDFEQVDMMPNYEDYTHVYGIDFGFSNDPTAIVHLAVDTRRKVVYVDEVEYRKRMLNSDIIDCLDRAHVPRQVPIYADCAEPKSIAEICNAGFNVLPCDKTAPTSDKLKFQIQFVKGWQLKVTKRSLNLIYEQRNYTWAKDKDGNNLNQPIDMFNHGLDAMRYGLYTHFGKRAGYGHYIVH